MDHLLIKLLWQPLIHLRVCQTWTQLQKSIYNRLRRLIKRRQDHLIIQAILTTVQVVQILWPKKKCMKNIKPWETLQLILESGLIKDTRRVKKRDLQQPSMGHLSWSKDLTETESLAKIMGREEMLAMVVLAFTTRVHLLLELLLSILQSKLCKMLPLGLHT